MAIVLRLFVLSGLLVLAASMTGLARSQELVFAVNEGVTYHVTPMETRERYRELGEMLSKATKRGVRVQPVDQYPVLRKNLESRTYDIAYVHPAHHALRAMRDQRYQLIAVTRGFTNYRARFLLKSGSPLTQPQQISGRRMVMPDPDSITAWMVRATLRDLGMDPKTESLGVTRYQDGIPFMMENGFYEVGITAANSVVKEWQSKGGKVLFESRPVPIKLVIASPDLAAADVERIQAVFLELDRSEAGRAILTKIGFQAFEQGDLKQLEQLTTWLGL